MGYFALPHNEDSWRQSLKTLKANIKLLEESEQADYLFGFMERSLEYAKQDYYKQYPDKLKGN